MTYRFTTERGRVVFPGDAGPYHAVDELATQADVLVVCCAYDKRSQIDPQVGPYVTGPEDCARLASMSSAHTSVLTHTTAGVDPPDRRQEVVETIQAVTNARVLSGDDQMTIDLT